MSRKDSKLLRKNFLCRFGLLFFLLLSSVSSDLVVAQSSDPMPSLSDPQVFLEADDHVLWGLNSTELAIGGSMATTAAAGGYGLYQLTKGGESIATVVAALIALEVASLATLGGLAIKASLAGLYLWPSDGEQQTSDVDLLTQDSGLINDFRQFFAIAD